MEPPLTNFTKETAADGFGSAWNRHSRLLIWSAKTINTAIERQQVEIVGSTDVVDLVKKTCFWQNLILVLSQIEQFGTKVALVQ